MYRFDKCAIELFIDFMYSNPVEKISKFYKKDLTLTLRHSVHSFM